MAPGLCTLIAFTTWNTSTTPSVLHLSIVVMIAQNVAERLTVLLYKEQRLIVTINRTHSHTEFSSFDSLTYMPWTTIALLPVLLWTLDTLSITAMIALLSEH